MQVKTHGSASRPYLMMARAGYEMTSGIQEANQVNEYSRPDRGLMCVGVIEAYEQSKSEDTQMTALKVSVAMPLALVSLAAGMMVCHAGPGAAPSAVTNRVNYILRLEWKDNKSPVRFLQLTTTEGSFQLNTSQPGAVKIGDSEMSISVTASGELNVLGSEHARLQLFLGRTVPYTTSRAGAGSNSTTTIQQRQEGLTAAFVVTFGKPLVIQKDEHGEISVLVKREEP